MLQRIGAGLMAVLNLILPIFRQAHASKQLARGVRVVLHLAVVLVILVGLYYLGRYFHVENLLKFGGPLRFYWLPILFLLVYTFCWLSWWLWTLLFPEAEAGAFPDIDAAWEAATAALLDKRLSLKDLPLFLVLGTPEDEERALIQAAQLKLEVAQAPAGADAPLHLYATRDSIYLTCAGASALGCYARNLVGKAPGHAGASAAEPAGGGGGEEEDILQTLSPSSSRAADPKRAVEKMASVLMQAEREGRPLTKAEKRELRCIYRQDNPQRSLIKKPDLIDEQVARLEYLCRLVVRDRSPYCPVNGILLLIPYAGIDSDADASDTSIVCQRDLSTAVAALRVHCPLYALVCDLETAPGFADFVKQFNPRERLRRIGQRSHLVPDFGRASTRGENGEPAPSRMIRSLAEWMCDSVVKTFVASKFQLEHGAGDLDPVVECNSRLFLFFDEMQQRGRRLGQILSGAIQAGRDPELLLFGGCYVSGTGNDAAHEQAFVKGVLDRLVESQSCVYWTDKALEEEAGFRRWRDLGWTLLVGVVVAMVALLGWLFFVKK